ncbi:molybdenum cofactor guanylyltransferase [Cellulomonas sp. URHD0024]|uniref:molybdenum cofactor guanylyltransferase n=1 Tax=Cellulomonas sp. URHD0024 TaxID=1302620 RepID=UPI00041A7B2C|nr:NTP transferase domain-containing protein [Cellulomonas sp. URHD0024]
MPDLGAAADAPVFDAVVLAGGRGTRLGGATKPEVVVGGRALLDHALAAVRDAAHVVVVGPRTVARPGIPTVLEDPPDGGPVAGLAAGLAAIPDPSALVVVLACDVPRAGAALPDLLRGAAGDGVDGARLVGAEGRPQHLVAVYWSAALRSALARMPSVHGASMRALVAGMVLVDVPDTDGSSADADTWPDVERLDAELNAERIDP